MAGVGRRRDVAAALNASREQRPKCPGPRTPAAHRGTADGCRSSSAMRHCSSWATTPATPRFPRAQKAGYHRRVRRGRSAQPQGPNPGPLAKSRGGPQSVGLPGWQRRMPMDVTALECDGEPAHRDRTRNRQSPGSRIAHTAVRCGWLARRWCSVRLAHRQPSRHATTPRAATPWRTLGSPDGPHGQQTTYRGHAEELKMTGARRWLTPSSCTGGGMVGERGRQRIARRLTDPGPAALRLGIIPAGVGRPGAGHRRRSADGHRPA